MTDKEKLLGRVRMYDFALVEVIEYLDGHPDNAAALKYYNEIITTKCARRLTRPPPSTRMHSVR